MARATGGGSAQSARAWLSRIHRPVIVELGAGTLVASVRQFSWQVIHAHGGRLVPINLRGADVPAGLDVGMAVNATGVQALDSK
jgi:hypothetical protein